MATRPDSGFSAAVIKHRNQGKREKEGFECTVPGGGAQPAEAGGGLTVHRKQRGRVRMLAGVF